MINIEINKWYDKSIDNIVKEVRNSDYNVKLLIKETQLDDFLIYWATNYLQEYPNLQLMNELWKIVLHQTKKSQIEYEFGNVKISINIDGIFSFIGDMKTNMYIYVDGKNISYEKVK